MCNPRINPMMRVKVCGVTCVDDALLAADAGVDAVGMLCYADAPRRIAPAQAVAIAAALPPFVTAVFLFVDAPAAVVKELASAAPRAWLQFHGREDAGYCQSFGRPYLKACKPHTATDVTATLAAHPNTSGLVCDGGGGQGRTFDWQLLPPPGTRTVPLILAGGLDPDNVAAAVAMTQPDAVDVSSGVCVKGDKLRKDFAKITAFIANAKARQSVGVI